VGIVRKLGIVYEKDGKGSVSCPFKCKKLNGRKNWGSKSIRQRQSPGDAAGAASRKSSKEDELKRKKTLVVDGAHPPTVERGGGY